MAIIWVLSILSTTLAGATVWLWMVLRNERAARETSGLELREANQQIADLATQVGRLQASEKDLKGLLENELNRNHPRTKLRNIFTGTPFDTILDPTITAAQVRDAVASYVFGGTTILISRANNGGTDEVTVVSTVLLESLTHAHPLAELEPLLKQGKRVIDGTLAELAKEHAQHLTHKVFTFTTSQSIQEIGHFFSALPAHLIPSLVELAATGGLAATKIAFDLMLKKSIRDIKTSVDDIRQTLRNDRKLGQIARLQSIYNSCVELFQREDCDVRRLVDLHDRIGELRRDVMNDAARILPDLSNKKLSKQKKTLLEDITADCRMGIAAFHIDFCIAVELGVVSEFQTVLMAECGFMNRLLEKVPAGHDYDLVRTLLNYLKEVSCTTL